MAPVLPDTTASPAFAFLSPFMVVQGAAVSAALASAQGTGMATPPCPAIARVAAPARVPNDWMENNCLEARIAMKTNRTLLQSGDQTMKTRINNLFTRLGVVPLRAGRNWVVTALIAGLGLIPAGGLKAQTFMSINFDGANPNGGLILSNNTLYGTAAAGDSSGVGTVFAFNTDGTGFTNLHSFTGGSDGANPIGGLILSGNTLYGTAYSGGSWASGTVFAVNTDGTGFTNLHSFTGGSDGANPIGGLILSSNTLYGATRNGGSSGNGTAFSLPLPPLPPVMRCKNVTVAAGANCNADAAIDDGSFSPNAGDTITLLQSPAGPYPLGETSVTL